MPRRAKAFDPDQAIGHAVSLFEAHDLIKRELDAAVNSAEGIMTISRHKAWGYAVAGAILGALALEVHLKALHAKCYGRSPQKHQLWSLYKRLPEQVKNDAEREYTALSALQTQVTSSVKMTLRDTLIEADNALERWRYAYEGTAGRYSYNFVKLVHLALLAADKVDVKSE